ncbi:MAG: diguanylate cyclase [Clostridia bacterium]|nr:diguanylate cyclase [Clostridia bacterium]
MKRGVRALSAAILVALILGMCAWSLWRCRQRGIEIARSEAMNALEIMAAIKRDDSANQVDNMMRNVNSVRLLADATDDYDIIGEYAASLGFDKIEIGERRDAEQMLFDDEGGLAIYSDAGDEGITLYVSPSRLSDMFGAPASEDRYYSFLVDSEGNILTRVENDGFLNISDNTVEFYSEAVLHDGLTPEDVSAALANGEGGSLGYSYGSRSNIVRWEPLGINDWALFFVATSDLIDENCAHIDEMMFSLGATLAICFFILISAAVLYIYRANRENREIRAELDDSLAVSRALNELSFTILFQCDMKTGDITYNESFARQLGRKPEITNVSQLSGADPALKSLVGEIKDGASKGKASLQLRHANGVLKWYQIYFMCVYGADEKKPVKVIGRIANIEWHEHEQDVQQAVVERDALTGLFGHTAFMRRAEKAFSANRNNCALVIIDIDDYKIISRSPDGYRGDELIVKMSDAMRKTSPANVIMGRISGDIFSVFLINAISREFLAERASILEREFGKTGHTCSIGIVMSDGTVNSIAELFARADKALYRVKLLGKRGYQFFDGARHTLDADDSADIEGDDANALILKCVLNIATGKTFEDAVGFALKQTARFYDASCAYVLINEEEKKRLVEIAIYRREKNGDVEALTVEYDKAPLLMKALRDHKPLSMVDTEEQYAISPDETDMIRKRGERSVYLVPLGEPGRRLGFIGIASPKYHVGNVAFLKTLAAVIGADIDKRKLNNRE